MTRDEIRRIVAELVAARENRAVTREALRAAPADERARWADIAAHKRQVAAERLMADVDARDILRALTVREVATPCTCSAVDKPPQYHATEEEVRAYVRAHEAGATHDEIARHYGRSRTGVGNAIRSWQNGRSRLAQRARDAGTWRRDGTHPDDDASEVAE